MKAWLIAFVFTQAVEVPLYRWGSASWVTAVAASCFTHPVVWFIIPHVCPPALGYWGMVLVAELFAIGVEAAWLLAREVPRPLAAAVLANVSSAGLGLLLRQLFGMP